MAGIDSLAWAGPILGRKGKKGGGGGGGGGGRNEENINLKKILVFFQD